MIQQKWEDIITINIDCPQRHPIESELAFFLLRFAGMSRAHKSACEIYMQKTISQSILFVLGTFLHNGKKNSASSQRKDKEYDVR